MNYHRSDIGHLDTCPLWMLLTTTEIVDNGQPTTSRNTLRPRQNGRHFADDIFKCIFVIENVWILIKISLKFVPKGPIPNIPTLVQIMAWCRPGDKPLSEPTMASLLTHICVTRPQWVNSSWYCSWLYVLLVEITIALSWTAKCREYWH